MPRRVLIAISSAASVLVWLAGCEGAPPATRRTPQTQPAEGPPSAASQPVVEATSKPGGGAVVGPAATQPAAREPKLPEYITLVEPFSQRQPPSVQAHTEGSNRLVIQTRNVRRLRIDRTRLPLDRRGSIALQLDEQGIEWLAKSDVSEFERSPNGYWEPFKPDGH